MRLSFKTLFFASLLLVSCQKKTPDTPAVLVPERLEIKPANGSVSISNMFAFSNIYYNTSGVEATVPPELYGR